MSDTTSISYADHTWSPWLGCEPVSPGCGHCYASAISKRAGRGAYRHGTTRVLTKDWEKPKRWNKRAPGRVLVSMCDPFDEAVPIDWKLAFFDTITETPNLDWLVLTKRPEAAKRFFEDHVFTHSNGGQIPLLARESLIRSFLPNVWLGVSVEDQERADERVPLLLSIPAKVRWLSVEPLLGPVNLETFLGWKAEREAAGLKSEILKNALCQLKDVPGVDWVVVGGESGFNHRKMELPWLESIVIQCEEAGVPCYVKQDSARFPGQQGRIPADLWKIKEFPKV